MAVLLFLAAAGPWCTECRDRMEDACVGAAHALPGELP